MDPQRDARHDAADDHGADAGAGAGGLNVGTRADRHLQRGRWPPSSITPRRFTLSGRRGDTTVPATVTYDVADERRRRCTPQARCAMA